MIRIVLTSAALALSGASSALAGDRELLGAVNGTLPGVASASSSAAGGSPNLVQTLYDRARTLQEQVRAAAPFSTACHGLGGWTARYAAAEVAAAEAFDRLQPSRARSLRANAAGLRARVTAARRGCTAGTPRRVSSVPALIEPRPFAASFGEITARAPAGSDRAQLFANGASAGPLAIAGGQARARLVGQAGRYTLEARFFDGDTQIGVARSPGVWLLPESAAAEVRVADLDTGLEADVKAAADAFSGKAGIWIHDLGSGRAAAWNAGARFPAASLVKLAVVVEALRRMGPQPEQSSLYHDVRAIGLWSSNLGANRLLGRIGGSAVAQRALGRMGATSSTYTGQYIVATERPTVSAPDPPPRVSGRVTTAADMATLLRVIHEAAKGEATALAATGLTRTQARLALGLLLASEQTGDNRGIFRDALGADVPAAQKQGWISSARHSAAIVYTNAAPVIVVALTYEPGLSQSEASGLGGRLVNLAVR